MLTRKEEDYLDIIYTLIKEKGYARIKDIAEKLNISLPSVSEMVQKFLEKGYIIHEKNAPIMLTKKGQEIAKIVKIKHATFKKFFEMILVPEEIAKKDSLKIEHNLNTRTIEQLQRFTEFFDDSKIFHKELGKFRYYCENKRKVG